MEQMQRYAFLLNISSRTIHDANSKDGRCRLDKISLGNKRLFATYQEARKFLPDGKKVTKPCTFCLGADYESALEK